MVPSNQITELLLDWSRGNRDALDELVALIYPPLRRIAHQHLRRERSHHTLQTTALVHEAYLALIDRTHVQWRDRAHFFGISANLMRQILIQHARKRHAAKRGGGAESLCLTDADGLSAEPAIDLIALNEALCSLEVFDSQKARIVELRFFGGLTVEETAEVLAISPRTVKREWRSAKAWLYCTIKKSVRLES